MVGENRESVVSQVHATLRDGLGEERVTREENSYDRYDVASVPLVIRY